MNNPMTAVDDYPLPAVAKMTVLRERILEVIYNDTQGLLPVFVESAQNLASAVLKTDRMLNDQVLSTLVLLRNHMWDDLCTSLEAARRLPAQGEQRDMAVRNRERDLEQDAQRDVERLESKELEIEEQLRALEALRLPATGQRSASLIEQRDNLLKLIASERGRMSSLDARIADTTLVIDAFDAPSVSKVFKGLIPTEQEVEQVTKALAGKGVSSDLLISASKRFVDNLSGVMEGRKLLDLTRARNRLVSERDAIRRELFDWDAKQAGLERELGQLPNVTVLSDLRSQWLEQGRVLTRSWAMQVAVMKQQTSLADLADRLAAMTRYLLAVRRLYEAV
ncbi:alpha-xenorhabdolysin family binary toxin subunit B [Pseudomonas sp. 5P_5.1_Bac1]|uniref:alpha-xenorhabdolysin family binary toxin subunit B n=1 Tax=Pseudomonas sp. 5P_5.1_Bac1 TaxID=2971616 RepID=UPI0021C83A67|nr:alpha-xenorhabdolysin family binary toxin subunit B [Pseudomonas sp. 5P_5.1_Bac1]MCU1721221.1 alpha-xenorhabdolysin family binary toxin subunit B [Pseudomonas sp. 5P_5.1_Bac1]